MRTVALESIKNVRDLGGIPVAGGRVVKRGLLFRGATLFPGTDKDFETLFGTLGIKRVLDLRIGYERDAKPDPVIEGVENLHIPFYDNQIVGYEYFKPLPGTITIGKDFACDPDDFYRDMANPLTVQQMSQVLHSALEAATSGTPVFYHCSNGKDRAGILSLLILEILGANQEDILKDYLLTNESRQAGIEGIYQRFLKLCQDDKEFAQRITDGHCARPENIEAFRQSVDQRYGTMQSFIRDILGFSDQDIIQLRERLTEPA